MSAGVTPCSSASKGEDQPVFEHRRQTSTSSGTRSRGRWRRAIGPALQRQRAARLTPSSRSGRGGVALDEVDDVLAQLRCDVHARATAAAASAMSSALATGSRSSGHVVSAALGLEDRDLGVALG